MNIEIKIGRDVEGPYVLRVPPSYKKVSRRHATLYWNDGLSTIEDNESANGTYVNGRRVAKVRIQEDDVVWLGGNGTDENCFQLDLKKVFASCRDAEIAQRTDFSNEFASIKQAYIDYQYEVSELKKQVTVKSQLPLRIVSFVPTLVGAIIAILPGADSNARIIAISVGGAITGLINILMIGKNTGASDQITDQITELQIKYQPHYCCPKCGMKYPFTTHWKKLEADGKCPNPKCNARFV